jgi:hypothetical protein
MTEKYTLRYETRFVPIEADPVEMTPKQAAAYDRIVARLMDQAVTDLYDRLLYGRRVSDVTVVEGQTVTRPELPEGGR